MGPMKLGACSSSTAGQGPGTRQEARRRARSAKSSRASTAIAWSIVDPDSGIKPNAGARQAGPRDGQEGRREDRSQERRRSPTLWRKAYFDSGDAAKALETQERAIRLMKESGEPVDQAHEGSTGEVQEGGGEEVTDVACIAAFGRCQRRF